MLPYPNATLRGPRGMLVITPAGGTAADLRRFQVFAPHGAAPAAGQQAAEQILQNAAQDNTAVQAIRSLYGNKWGSLDGLAPDQVVARLRLDLADGHSFAAFYIPSPDTVQYVITTRAETSTLLQDPAGDPLKWSPAQRIGAMLRRIPAHLPGALAAQVTALFTPKAVALTAIMLAALAVAQAYGVGEIVDLILVAAAWAAAGWGGLVALKDFIAAIIDAAGQTTIAPIEADAEQAADALVVLGITFVTAVLLRAQDQEKMVSLEKPPPEEPVVVRKPEPAKGWKEFPSTAETAPAGDGLGGAADRGGSGSPDFVVSPDGTAFPVPKGATGPTPVVNSAGNQTGSAFTGGSGGANGQVSTMRMMDPTPPRGASPGYPNGYIKYENSMGQGVDPYTGRTIPNSRSHFPIN